MARLPRAPFLASPLPMGGCPGEPRPGAAAWESAATLPSSLPAASRATGFIPRPCKLFSTAEESGWDECPFPGVPIQLPGCCCHGTEGASAGGTGGSERGSAGDPDSAVDVALSCPNQESPRGKLGSLVALVPRKQPPRKALLEKQPWQPLATRLARGGPALLPFTPKAKNPS